MSSKWIQYVKNVQHELGGSYKEAMIEASKRRKSGGATWKLTEEQKKQYIADKNNGVNQVTRDGATYWQH